MMARFLSFGEDALADTFYSVGVVVSLCQLMSVLELFHIADEIEKAGLLPRFIQVMERNFVLFVVIISQEEVQSKSIVCIQFFLWNTLDLLRYPHGLLALFSTPSFSMLWVRHTLWIPLYPLSVIAEGLTVYQALPYFESLETFSFPYILLGYFPLLAIGACFTMWQLLGERKQQLDIWNKKTKRK
ncbi:very-long-chain (3R)-3-hydroxyacyl-CoA dehydratase 4 isoform X4 [Anguilla rostrata]